MAQQTGTLVNGQSYTFCDITVAINGVSDINPAFSGIPIKSISWDTTRSKTANFENSAYATSYSYGKISTTGSFTLTKDTAEMLRSAIADSYMNVENSVEQSMVGLPAFDFIITYAVGGKLNTVTIKYVAITSEKNSASEGDDLMNVTCDFIAARVSYENENSLQSLGVIS